MIKAITVWAVEHPSGPQGFPSVSYVVKDGDGQMGMNPDEAIRWLGLNGVSHRAASRLLWEARKATRRGEPPVVVDSTWITKPNGQKP